MISVTPRAELAAPLAYLVQVVAFHAAHGGPFLRSIELEYAVRRLARAWLRTRLSALILTRWLVRTTAFAFPPGAATAHLTRELRTWVADECRPVAHRARCLAAPSRLTLSFHAAVSPRRSPR